MSTQYLPDKSTMETILKYWPIITVVLSLLGAATWQSVSWAIDVDTNQNNITSEVVRMKSDVKKISDVQVDVNRLNVSNARLQSEVKHINESIQRTEMIQQDTNALLREVIKKQQAREERPEPINYERERYDPRYFNSRPSW